MPRGGARPGSGRKPKAEPRPAKVAPTLDAPVADVLATGKTPLQYMLDTMNDPGVDERLRAQMAVAAAPYMHAKKGESGSKKDEQADKAKAAAAGRFRPAAPPLKLVARK